MKFRVFYRTVKNNQIWTQPKSVMVKAYDKENAITVAVRTLTLRGEVCIPTGYVTEVGKRAKPL